MGERTGESTDGPLGSRRHWPVAGGVVLFRDSPALALDPAVAQNEPARADLAWRRGLHLYAHEPALTFAWRVLPRFPRLSATLKRLYLHGGSQVPNSREPVR